MLINLVSNVWIYILNLNNNISTIKKIEEKYNITKLINIDKEFSDELINTNLNTQKQLIKKIKKYCNFIVSSNLNKLEKQHNILFIVSKKINYMFLIHLYLYIKYLSKNNNQTNINNIINIISCKYRSQDIFLSDRMKELLLL